MNKWFKENTKRYFKLKKKFFQKMFISWKLINGLKKIEKEIFPVGKIKGKESFSTVKEIV